MTIMGTKWAPSILPLVIMSLGMIFRMNNVLLKIAMTSMGRADLSLVSNFLQLVFLLPLTVYAMKYGVVGLVVAWVSTEFLVLLAAVQLSKRAFDISSMRLLRSYRPALVSSLIMAGCVIGIKALLGNQSGMAVFAIAIATGIASYYVATRLLFLKELRTALKTVFGERFAFLAPRPGKS
jgi:O-antigen/teichoic acid export membrane protein